MIFSDNSASALQRLLTSSELEEALVASLLGEAGRRSVHIDGHEIAVPAYLRLLSRLSREAAEQTGEAAHETIGEEEVARTSGEQERCREDWLKLFNSLPEPLRQALARRDFNNAIVIAIHHGWRDLDKLTDLIFLAENGERRGYCRLGWADADRADRKWWGEKKAIIRGYLSRPSPPMAQHGGIRCRKVEFRRDGPQPEWRKPDLTGRYEYREFDTVLRTEVTRYMVSINQAGRHVEGLMTRVLSPKSSETSRTQHRIYGDLQSDGSFLVFSLTKPAEFWGYLHVDSSGRLFWRNDEAAQDERWASTNPLSKYSDEPTLMESAFSPGGFSPDGLVQRQEWFPLTTTQKKNLVIGLGPDRIEPLLEACFSTPQGFKAAEQRAVVQECHKPWNYIAGLLDKEIHPTDRMPAIHYARTVLALNRWTFKTAAGATITLSHLDWLQAALDRIAESGATPDVRGSIHGYLWLKPRPSTSTKHTYKVTASLKGAALIAGYFRGDITISKQGAKAWQETFRIVLKGFQVGRGFSVSFEGTAKAYDEWSPADFPGPVDLLAAKAGAKLLRLEASAGAAVMTIFGSGRWPPLIATSQDVDVDIDLGKKEKRSEHDVTKKKWWKIDPPDLSGRWGEIRTKQLSDQTEQKVHVATDYAHRYGFQNDVHFCLGSALLTQDARQALRIVCANELAGFGNPDSRLSVLGFADTVGYKDATAEQVHERNRRLSLLRAQNTVQAIRDILGDRFRIPEQNIKVTGEGQQEAEKAGLALGQPDPRFRRVDVVLNSMLVISLRV
jgi:hypothetical protein